jgi:hypothetical protein
LRSGSRPACERLPALDETGVNDVPLHLGFNRADIETMMNRLADTLSPAFAT